MNKKWKKQQKQKQKQHLNDLLPESKSTIITSSKASFLTLVN